MKALVVGNKNRYDELLLKLPQSVTSKHFHYWEIVEGSNYDLIFDLNFDESIHSIDYVATLNIPVFACAVKRRLTEIPMDFNSIHCNLIGMNCLPGFINRDVIEVSLLKDNQEAVEAIIGISAHQHIKPS